MFTWVVNTPNVYNNIEILKYFRVSAADDARLLKGGSLLKEEAAQGLIACKEYGGIIQGCRISSADTHLHADVPTVVMNFPYGLQGLMGSIQ